MNLTPSKNYNHCIIFNEYILIEKTTIKNKLLIMFQLRKKKIQIVYVQGCITSKASSALCSLFRENKIEAPGCSFQQHRKKSIKEDSIFAHPVFLLCSNIMFSIHTEDRKGTQHAVYTWWNIVMASFRMQWQTQFQISGVIVEQPECWSPKGLTSNLATSVLAWRTTSPVEFLWDNIKGTE